MRIDLLFGFLGSGKTTIARRILEQWAPKEKLALIVNEFGDVGVDVRVDRALDRLVLGNAPRFVGGKLLVHHNLSLLV